MKLIPKNMAWTLAAPLIFMVCCGRPDKQTTGAKNGVILAPVGSHATDWSLDENLVPGILDGAKAHLEQKLANPVNALERDNITAILLKWNRYSCQVFPVIRKQDGAKMVTMSFFPTCETASMLKDWRKAPVIVKGGGSDFWTLSYNPDKREYFAFGVNASQ